MSAFTKASTVTLPSAIGRFAVHFMEMCAVMCIGGGLLDLAVFSAAPALGYPSLASSATPLAIMIIAIDGAVLMAAYMFMRHHPAQHNVEMSGSTVVGGLAWVGAFWLGGSPSRRS